MTALVFESLNSSSAFRNSTPGAAAVLLNPDIMSVVTQFTATHALDATCRALHQVNYQVGIFRSALPPRIYRMSFEACYDLFSKRSATPGINVQVRCHCFDAIELNHVITAFDKVHVVKLSLWVPFPFPANDAMLSRIRELDLRCSKFANLDILTGLGSLEVLNIPYADIQDLSLLKDCPRLKSLSLSGSRLTEESLRKLSEFHSGLQTLSFSCESLTSLEVMTRFPSLRELELGGIMKLCLKPLFALKRLECLDIHSRLCRDEDLIELSKTLRILAIGGETMKTMLRSGDPRQSNPGLDIQVQDGSEYDLMEVYNPYNPFEDADVPSYGSGYSCLFDDSDEEEDENEDEDEDEDADDGEDDDEEVDILHC